MKIKVIKQVYTTPVGLGASWAVILDNQPMKVYYTKGELEAFLRGLNG